MIDTNKTQYSSAFSGFKNVLPDVLFSAAYAGGTIAASGPSSGGFTGPIRAQAALSNVGSVSQVQVKFTGLESFYRLLPGTFAINYPSRASTQYQIEVFSYFSGNKVTVDAYIINQTGGSVTVPAITFNCTASLFIAPF